MFRVESNGIVIDPDLTSTTASGSTASSLERTIHRKYDPTLGRGTGYLLTQGSDITSTLEAETTYRYSATNGRFAAITSNPVGAGYTTTHDFIYGYENNSNLLKTTQSFTNYNFSTNSGTAIHQVTRNYEGNRNVLASIINKNSSTNLDIYATAYSVNEIGQRDAVTRSGSGTATPASASAAYTYNERGELATANEATDTLDRAYEYDGIGNREKSANSLTLPSAKNYTVNALNQYTAVNLGTSVSPAYDDDGNATAYPLPVNLVANAALTYDGENRLIKVVTGSTTVEYTYDALSRRIIKTVGTQRTYYIYNGWNCISEYTGTKHTTGSTPILTRTQSYTWGLDLSQSMQGAGGVGGLLAVTEIPVSSAPVTYYPLYDGNGNITAYIDETCDVEASFDYDPFGNITNNNNPLNFTYAFSTKPKESDTGLYYYGYRWYDAVMGRWINRDPIEENGGLNLYGFVGNNGADLIDILGYYPTPGRVVSAGTAINFMRNEKIDKFPKQAYDKIKDSKDTPEIVKENLTNDLAALAYLAHQFRTGKVDDGGNRFVYTCKCGWIDLGHFFNNAVSAYIIKNKLQQNGIPFAASIAQNITYSGSILLEAHQATAKVTMASGPLWEAAIGLNCAAGDPLGLAPDLPNINGIDGWSSSAFTLEDLPSNWMGAKFGTHVNGTGNISDSLKNIRTSMEQMFADCGAVEYNWRLEVEARRHEKNAVKRRFFGGLIGRGSESFNFSRRPKEGIYHDCHCDKNNNPIKNQ